MSREQLVEDFAKYLYLPRFKGQAVLIEAIREGLRLLTWSQDSFAYADTFDEAAAAPARSSGCKGLTTMLNSIYNGYRIEDVWLDK